MTSSTIFFDISFILAALAAAIFLASIVFGGVWGFFKLIFAPACEDTVDIIYIQTILFSLMAFAGFTVVTIISSFWCTFS